MSWPIIIELAGPARGKGAGRAVSTARGPRIFTDSRTRTYEAQLRFAAQQAMGEIPPTREAVFVKIEVRIAVPLSWSKRARAQALAGEIYPVVKPDCNNFSKALDAFNGIVWVDDKQIVREIVEKRYADQPGLLVIVSHRRL